MDIEDGRFVPRQIDINHCPQEQGRPGNGSWSETSIGSTFDSSEDSGYGIWNDEAYMNIKISKIVMYEDRATGRIINHFISLF